MTEVSSSLATLLLVPNVVAGMQFIFNTLASLIYLLPVVQNIPYMTICFFLPFGISTYFTERWGKNKSPIVKFRLALVSLALLAISNSLLVFFASRSNFTAAIFKFAVGVASGIASFSTKDFIKIHDVTGSRIWGLKAFNFAITAAMILSLLLCEVLVLLLDISVVKYEAVSAVLSWVGLAVFVLRFSDLHSCSTEVSELLEDYDEKDHEQDMKQESADTRKMFVVLAPFLLSLMIIPLLKNYGCM